MLEGLGAAHPDHQPRTGRPDDTQRYTGVETLGGERQRIEHRESLAVVELTPHRRGAAANRDVAVRGGGPGLRRREPRPWPSAPAAPAPLTARPHPLGGGGGG